MNTKAFPEYFKLDPNAPDLPANQHNLFRALQAGLAYVPILLGFNALGFIIVYVLGSIGLLDKNDSRILIVAGISLLTSILHIPLFSLLRRRQLNLVSMLLMLINSLGAVSQVFLWQGFVWFPLVLALSPVLVFVAQRGLQPRYRWLGFAYGVLITISILYLERVLSYERMRVADSLSQMAALSIYFTVSVAMFVLILMHTSVNFRTISARLVTTFTFVTFLSAITIVVIAALASLFFDRQGVLQELSAMSAMKTSQVSVTLTGLEQDTALALTDQLTDQRIKFLLANRPGTLLYQVNSELVRAYLIRQKAQNSRYQELLLLDATGKALISTLPANEGRDFSAFNFFQNALVGTNSAIEFDFPAGSDKTSILVIRPITTNSSLSGAVAIRISFDVIKQIMATKIGVGETSETYLVSMINGKFIPLTNTRQESTEVNSLAAQEALVQHINSGAHIYENYAGTSVLGSYVGIPALKIVVIAEVEQQEITQKTVRIVTTNMIFGIFAAILAFSIVLITSRSISMPLVYLAEKATALASGELSTRMIVDRQDEIGALASSFNSMASELQSLVKTLEQKVEDRTQDLQKQASYLRLAAEVARDSANTNNLDELLNRAAELILDRFGFYHTGIFLLDEHGEYAVLQASPTEAGREMLARNHKLRVGQEGIVGNVAATREPRIALDTGLDVAHFNNPLLPMTRSEMALPLKVSDQLLGVLDVQSEQPEAFTQDDISTLQIMADQLALAIQRVRLSQEQEYNLRQLESTYQSFTLSSWQKFSGETTFKPGYHFDGVKLTTLDIYPEYSQEVLRKGRSVVLPGSGDTKSATLAVPLKLRDQILGVMTIGFEESAINPDTINLAEEIANRLAVALENARLYSETQKQAEQTRAVSEISNRITASVNIENILRTTVEELGRLNPSAEITVRIQESKG